MPPASQALSAQQGAGGDAHGGVVRVVGRAVESAIVARALPTRTGCRVDSAGWASHAPARMCQAIRGAQIARPPPGVRRSAPAFSSAESRLARFDRGRQSPVQLGAIGFELGFVGDRADQRVAERVFGSRA